MARACSLVKGHTKFYFRSVRNASRFLIYKDKCRVTRRVLESGCVNGWKFSYEPTLIETRVPPSWSSIIAGIEEIEESSVQKRSCKFCKNYPCFKGIETLSSDFGQEGCHGYNH